MAIREARLKYMGLPLAILITHCLAPSALAQPATAPAVRVLGGVEVLAACTALAAGGVAAAVVAVLYAALALAAGRLLARSPGTACGCSY